MSVEITWYEKTGTTYNRIDNTLSWGELGANAESGSIVTKLSHNGTYDLNSCVFYLEEYEDEGTTARELLVEWPSTTVAGTVASGGLFFHMHPYDLVNYPLADLNNWTQFIVASGSVDTPKTLLGSTQNPTAEDGVFSAGVDCFLRQKIRIPYGEIGARMWKTTLRFNYTS